MCSPAPCRNCGKTTWSGCGQHANQIMAQVPKNNRCTCDAHTPESLFSRLFSRSK